MRTDCILPTNGLKSMPRIKLTSNMSIYAHSYIIIIIIIITNAFHCYHLEFTLQ